MESEKSFIIQENIQNSNAKEVFLKSSLSTREVTISTGKDLFKQRKRSAVKLTPFQMQMPRGYRT